MKLFLVATFSLLSLNLMAEEAGFVCEFTNSKDVKDKFQRTFMIDPQNGTINSSFGVMRIENNPEFKNLIKGSYKTPAVENSFSMDRYSGEAFLSVKTSEVKYFIGTCKKKEKLI